MAQQSQLPSSQPTSSPNQGPSQQVPWWKQKRLVIAILVSAITVGISIWRFWNSIVGQVGSIPWKTIGTFLLADIRIDIIVIGIVVVLVLVHQELAKVLICFIRPIIDWYNSESKAKITWTLTIAGTILSLYIIQRTTDKDVFALIQYIMIPLAVILGNYLLNLTLKKVEHLREDLKESAAAYKKFRKKINSFVAEADYKTNQDKIDDAIHMTLEAFSRVVPRDKLRIITLLIKKELINADNPIILLIDADLSMVNFFLYGGPIASLSFRGANLQFANFSGKDLSGTDFSNADLSHARFNRAILDRIILVGARFSKRALRKAVSRINIVY